MPQNTTQAVELLRFVTAYKKGIEALVDITPYSALLRSSADEDGELTFFAFIDTWVGNNTPDTRNVYKLDSAGTCSAGTTQKEAWGDGGRSGNGWQIDADLVFFPKAGTVDIRPRESITLSSGYYGSYSIGSITAHEATLTAGGSAIEMTDGVDLTGALDAEVYACPLGVKDMEKGLKMGQRAKSAFEDEAQASQIAEEVYKELLDDSVFVLSVSNSNPSNKEAEVTFDPKTTQLKAGMPVWYEADDIVSQNGTSYGVFPASKPIGSVLSVDGNKAIIKIEGACFPGNSSGQWLPRLKIEKFPDAVAISRKGADSMKTVKKRIPDVANESGDSEEFVSLLSRNRKHLRGNQAGDEFKPFLVGRNKDNSYSRLPPLGHLNLNGVLNKDGADCAPAQLGLLQTSATEEKLAGKPNPGSVADAAQRLLNKANNLAATQTETKAGQLQTLGGQVAEGDKVCILTRRATGRVFERSFNMPSFVPMAAAGGAALAANAGASGVSTPTAAAGNGDRVLLQFSVTGHGWSGSTEQCGEFCHAVYDIKMNGKPVASVTEWRDDCEKNPVGNQYGTWEIHRDGWCPGSVEPGLYIDVTKFANANHNTVSVDLRVWSSKSHKYEKYINYGNYFGGGDGAVLFVGATLFIYDADAAATIGSQSKAYTAAERALRNHGCSHEAACKPPADVNSGFGASLMEVMPSARSAEEAEAAPTATKKALVKKVQKHVQKEVSASSSSDQNGPYDFEARSPWYQYSQQTDGLPGARQGAKVVNAFKDALIQINAREIRVKVNRKALPDEWGSAAMLIRLETPHRKWDDQLAMDNWDRVGSLGLVYETKSHSSTNPQSRVGLHPLAEEQSPAGLKHRKLTATWTNDIAASLHKNALKDAMDLA
jgi:hypothetical protein